MPPFRIMRLHHHRQRGVTLTELLVASAVGILIVLAMSYMLMNSMKARNELIKTSRQIENGRHAMDELRQEIQLAGFYGSYLPSQGISWTTPDPCATSLDGLEFSAQPVVRVPVGIQGFTQDNAAPACITNRLKGTDILVMRRVETKAMEIDREPADNQIDAGVPGKMGRAFYLQVSHCPDPAKEPPFVLSSATDMDAFSLHKVTPAGNSVSCIAGQRSEIWRYVTYLYYVSSCNDCRGDGDGIPTLKMVKVSPVPVERVIAEGIQDMQVEYGFDTNGDGTPDTFEAGINTSQSAHQTAYQWQDVVAVKIFLLARNAESNPEYRDEKPYLMGSDGRTVGPFNDAIRRQAYVSTTMAHNIAGRRQQ